MEATRPAGTALPDVAKVHDTACNNAQSALVNDLLSGRSPDVAYRNFFISVTAADRIFVEKAGSVVADDPWRGSVRAIGVNTIDVKARA